MPFIPQPCIAGRPDSPTSVPMEEDRPVLNETTPVLNETTLLVNEEEGFALEPVAVTRKYLPA